MLVAMSLGGFTAPIVAERVPLSGLAFVNAMIPAAGETAAAWWDNNGWEAARSKAARDGGCSEAFDLDTYFLHDVPPEVAAAGEEHQRDEAGVAFAEASTFTAWPDIPTHVIAGRDDGFFLVAFHERVAPRAARRRCGRAPGGHLTALSHPEAPAGQLLGYP